METDKSKPKTPKEHATEEPAGATAHTILEQGAEAYGQAEQAASEAYDHTARKVSETYAQAKSYSHDNPGKTMLIALGLGVGLGLLLGASARMRRSRTSRIAEPIVNALSDIAAELFQ
jgi:ElaB/YqjD/DUF883 family membrane-anchored ribosome-binding protein